jgi:hypothetical protein
LSSGRSGGGSGNGYFDIIAEGIDGLVGTSLPDSESGVVEENLAVGGDGSRGRAVEIDCCGGGAGTKDIKILYNGIG